MLRTITSVGSVVLLSWSFVTHAVQVNIQGTILLPDSDGGTCINIAGDYPGVRIEPSVAGRIPQVCYSDAKEDIVALRNVTFVATAGTGMPESSSAPTPNEGATKGDATGPGTIVIEFMHTFPPGPNGMVMARSKIDGFFATENGIGVASGDRIRFVGVFSQAGRDDTIADPLDHQVGKTLDSAMFQYNGKKRYLIAGSRTLKARLEFSFVAPGQKLSLLKGASVGIDNGSRFEDKLEEMEAEGADLMPKGGAQESPDEEDEFSF